MKALRLSPDLVESGPLNQLIAIESALAWDVLRQIRPAFSEPRKDFLLRVPAIRLDAFESFIRGVVAGAAADKIRYLKAAVAINPQYAQPILLLAKTYFAEREYEQAAQWFARLPADDPATSEAHFLLGLCEYHLGRFEKASAAFKTTAERVPLTEVLNNAGAAESRLGHRDAAAFFEKAVAADPSDPDYHFNLALALCRKGDIAAAQRQLRETLSRRPNDAEARQFQESLAASITAAAPVTAPVHPPALPLPRIKSNYDESSYRQLAVELQNAIEASIGKAKPSDRPALSRTSFPRLARLPIPRSACSPALKPTWSSPAPTSMTITPRPLQTICRRRLPWSLIAKTPRPSHRKFKATPRGFHPSSRHCIPALESVRFSLSGPALRTYFAPALGVGKLTARGTGGFS
jgi:tetratricopeptide (TPR) repeat protein